MDWIKQSKPFFLATSEAPVRRCCIELLKYIDAEDTLAEFRKWVSNAEKFSIGGLELMNAGIPKGPSIRNTLNYLHYLWIKVSSYLSGSNAILCF